MTPPCMKVLDGFEIYTIERTKRSDGVLSLLYLNEATTCEWLSHVVSTLQFTAFVTVSLERRSSRTTWSLSHSGEMSTT
jgi:hypothetical protein